MLAEHWRSFGAGGGGEDWLAEERVVGPILQVGETKRKPIAPQTQRKHTGHMPCSPIGLLLLLPQRLLPVVAPVRDDEREPDQRED